MARPDFWPNSQQELLLTAALANREAALRAWSNWRSRASSETTDGASLRLMPLVYFNLARAGASDASMTTLKRFYLRTRCANKLRFERLGKLLVLFESRGIPTLLLKGAALTLQVYRDPGLRPMADLDLAVPHDCAGRAVALLQAHGWSLMSAQSRVRARPGFIAAMSFSTADGAQCDLHFSLFPEALAWQAVEPFWLAATPMRVGDTNSLCLAAADNLLHILAHGARANSLAPIRWVADAIWLLRSEQAIAWDRFIREAIRLRLTLVAFRTLAYLRDKHEAAVPPAVMNSLRRRHSALERLEYAARRGRLRHVEALMIVWGAYVRQRSNKGLFALTVGFPGYLRVRWSARTLLEVAWIAFAKSPFGRR